MEENILKPDLEVNNLVEEEEEFHHLNNPAEGIKPIIKKYLGVPTHAQQVGNKFFFSDGDARVEVNVITDEIIRFAVSAPQRFSG